MRTVAIGIGGLLVMAGLGAIVSVKGIDEQQSFLVGAISLPADAELSLDALTVRGTIQSDFPFSRTEDAEGKRLSGRLGEQASSLSVRTATGSVKITRRTK